VVTRSADADDEIGGFAIPAGSRVLVSPYVTQHDPALWDDPEGFDPERFAPEAQEGRPRYAYFPFGGGPHLCIGAGFAIMEATIVLATGRRAACAGSRARAPGGDRSSGHAAPEARHLDDRAATLTTGLICARLARCTPSLSSPDARSPRSPRSPPRAASFMIPAPRPAAPSAATWSRRPA
jgi:hypothetical protein